jgi:hypothetical protein
MFCPRCRAEYRDKFSKCKDCGIDLLPGTYNTDKTPANKRYAISILKYILAAGSIYPIFRLHNSLSINLAQRDDAWIPDAIMLLSILVIDAGIIFSEIKKASQSKIFKIYRNSTEKHVAVKQGWSWPAFFFQWYWALCKKLWATALATFSVVISVVFLAIFSLNYLADNIEISAIDTYDVFIILFFSLIGFALSFLYGSKGNAWRKKNLESRGFVLSDTVRAANVRTAISPYRNTD